MLFYSISVLAQEIGIIDLDQKIISNPFPFSGPYFQTTFEKLDFLFIPFQFFNVTVRFILVFKQTSL
jgi:hypothetical protein